MSYAYNKDRIFRAKPSGDEKAEVTRKRSEGRMKTYDSCTDNRAWSIDEEEKRKYLLDLVKKPPSVRILGSNTIKLDF